MDRPHSRRVCRYLGFLSLLVAFVGIATPSNATQVIGSVVGGTPQQAPPAPNAPGGPPRDRVPRRVGTAVIRGRVFDAATGNPIPRARVRVQSGPPTIPQILTDTEGAFEFVGLPAGAYMISVEKATYMASRIPEPSTTTMRGRMRPLALRDGQVVDGLKISLFRGGAITGRIFDAHGDPVEFAQVRAARVGRSGRPMMGGQTQTNDLGEYRLPRLATGRYVIQVRPQVGQGPFVEGMPIEAPLPQPVPTYYPSALSAAQAQPVAVTRGETLSGLDITLAEGIPSVVTGTVVRADGEPVNMGSVSARSINTDSFVGGFDFGGGTGIRPGGAFRLTLAPGDYVLEAETGMFTPNGPPREMIFGSAKLTVGNGTTEAITIVVGRGATATGKIVFESGTPPPTPPSGQLSAPLYNPDGPGCRGGMVTIASDWTFKAEGLTGTCAAQPQGTFGRWTLKSVTYRGQNLADQLVTFEPGQQYADVQIVVSDKRTILDLRVTGDDGQVTKDYVAIAYPVDKSKWKNRVRFFMPPTPLDMEMRRAFAPPSGAGTAANLAEPHEGFSALPVGEYFVIALDDIGSDDWQDPEVLERLSASASRVSLTDEAPIEVPLRRVTLSEIIR
jgi:hypothetical protein